MLILNRVPQKQLKSKINRKTKEPFYVIAVYHPYYGNLRFTISKCDVTPARNKKGRLLSTIFDVKLGMPEKLRKVSVSMIGNKYMNSYMSNQNLYDSYHDMTKK